MTFAGKRLTLQNPPEALASKHGTFRSDSKTFLKVCFSCLASRFFHENHVTIPEKYNQEETLPWTETLCDFTDILKGVENANRHKEQLLMWIPNTSIFCGNTNLHKVMGDISDIHELSRFMSLLTIASDMLVHHAPCVQNYIKAKLRKKILELPHTDWPQLSEVINSFSIVFSRKESSEIMLEWFLTNS
jgi:hypothetical protein